MGKQSYNPLPLPPPSRAWHTTKLALRILSLLLCLTAIALQIPTSLSYKREADRLNTPYAAYTDIAIVVVPPFLILLFDLAESATLCVRHGQRRGGLHPGVHVAFELVFWLACAILTALIAGVAWFAGDNVEWIRGLVEDSGVEEGWVGDGSVVVDYADLRVFEGYALKTKVAAGLFGCLTVTRFILFVRACVETHQRRRARKGRGRGMGNPIIITTQHNDSEASVPLTAYDPVIPLPGAPPQYYDYAKPVVHVSVGEHPAYRQQPRY